MNQAAIILAPQEQAAWDASDAVIEKHETELDRIWRECNARGMDAMQGVMDYLRHIEGQNKRLNKRVEMLESVVLHADLLQQVLNELPHLKARYEKQSQCDSSTQEGNGHDGNT